MYIEKPLFEDHLVQLARAYAPATPALSMLDAHDQMRVSPR
jgi:hypothetical protein